MHFDIHIDPTYAEVQAQDLENILAKEISLRESIYFQNLTIDSNSLEVKPSDVLPTVTTTQTTIPTEPTTEKPEPRQCSLLKLEYCNKLGYNITTYPNIFGHKNLKDVKENIIPFRELVISLYTRMCKENNIYNFLSG